MSLIRRRRSVLFSNPQQTSSRIQIQQILSPHKKKLEINDRSLSTPRQSFTEKLSVSQAVKIENLSKTIDYGHKRRQSLNDILRGFDRNCLENIEDSQSTINQDRLKLFCEGKYYRNTEVSSSAAKRKVSPETLGQYFRFEDELEGDKKFHTLHNHRNANRRSYLNRKRPTCVSFLPPSTKNRGQFISSACHYRSKKID